MNIPAAESMARQLPSFLEMQLGLEGSPRRRYWVVRCESGHSSKLNIAGTEEVGDGQEAIDRANPRTGRRS
jgi:hypothetical protein